MDQEPRGKESERNLVRRLLAIVAISLLIGLAVIALCWFAMQPGERTDSNECLVRDEWRLPSQLSEMAQLKMATPDFRTLVGISGFLKYTNEEKGIKEYLPLKLHNLTLSEGQNGESALVLWTRCAKLTLNLASNSRQVMVGSIEVSTAKVEDYRRECQVTSTAILLPDLSSSRYSCNTPASYECRSSFWHNNDTYLMKTIAILELHSLELELEGEAEIIRTNEFSKRPAEC